MLDNSHKRGAKDVGVVRVNQTGSKQEVFTGCKSKSHAQFLKALLQLPTSPSKLPEAHFQLSPPLIQR